VASPVSRPQRDETHEVTSRVWLIDSGCAFDLLSSKNIPDYESGKLRNRGVAPVLRTANGLARPKGTAKVRIGSLDEVCEPLIMADSPDVLSMGRRCVKMGYSFHWPAGSLKPYLIRPDGVKVELIVRD